MKDVESNELNASPKPVVAAPLPAIAKRPVPTYNKVVVNDVRPVATIATTSAPRTTTVTTVASTTTTTPRPVASSTTPTVVTTKRTRRPSTTTTATTSLPIASVPKETNTLLESALKHSGAHLKIVKKPLVEVTTVDRPTTIIADEAAATEAIVTTDLPRTTPEFLYTRIVPELIERNDKVPAGNAIPLFSTLMNTQSNGDADELIRNIKQLSATLSASSSSAAAAAAAATGVNDGVANAERKSPVVHAPLPRRFLFKADAIKNRLKQ